MEGRARAGKPYKDDPGPAFEPKGTRSQSMPYSLMGLKIAVCHQYKRPDGSFGASGKPDPKIIEYGIASSVTQNPRMIGVPARSVKRKPKIGAKCLRS